MRQWIIILMSVVTVSSANVAWAKQNTASQCPRVVPKIKAHHVSHHRRHHQRSQSAPLSSQPNVKAASVIHINQADAKTLTTLKGLGAKRAQAIVAYRQQHGLFKTFNGLTAVKRINEKLLARIVKNNPDRAQL